MPRAVIVGGGIAGLAVAHTLKDKLKDGIEVTVVTKDPFYMAGPTRPLLLTGEQKYERIIRGYEYMGTKGINVEYGLVTKVDPAERKVEVTDNPTRPATSRSLDYDYLILAPGVVLDGTSIKGYRENRHKIANVYEPGRVDVLKHWVWSITRGTIIVYAPPMPYRCAPAPSETALLIHTILTHRGVRGNTRIIHVDANPKPQPPFIADLISQIYEKAGIELITSKKIDEIAKDHIVLDDGEKITYDILAMLEPNRAPSFIREAGLGQAWFEIRSPTDLRSPSYDDVLAAGDTAKLPFPKNQEIAFESALYAANRIIEEHGGEPANVQYSFIGWTYVGNLEGRLETLSLQFGLKLTTKPPTPTKDPVPQRKYTLDKDAWEQGYLNKLFGYTPKP